MAANDNGAVIRAFNPTKYLELAIQDGKEEAIVQCLAANALLLEQDKGFFPGDAKEQARLELEHLIRVQVDTFILAEVLDTKATGDAVLTSLIHNAARVLAMAVINGANFDAGFDSMVARFRDQTRREIEDIRRAGF